MNEFPSRGIVCIVGVFGFAVAVAVAGADTALVHFNGHRIEVGESVPRLPGSFVEAEATKSRADARKAFPATPELRLVALDLPLGPTSFQHLRELGYEWIAYLPPDGFLVKAGGGAHPAGLGDAEAPLVVALPRHRSAVLRPAWKIAPSLSDFTAAARAMASDVLPPEIGVIVQVAGDGATLDALLLSAGGIVTGRKSGTVKSRFGARVPTAHLEGFLDTVSRHPAVYSIQPGGGARLLNDNASRIVQTGTPVGARKVWDAGLRGEGQTIAILDTGLDYDACYFAEADASAPPLVLGTGIGTPDPTRRKVAVYNLLYSGDWELESGRYDNQGHGTLVAGNAAGSNLAAPFAGDTQNGMAPAARLIVQDAGFVGWDDCADLAALGCPVVDLTPFLDQAVAQGANIHNNSWGDRETFFPQNTYTAPTADMDEAVWRHPDFLIFCAAGNSSHFGNDSVGSPSVGKNVISVGATQSPSLGGDAERLAWFSSLGWAADGRIKPDLTAPGQTFTASSDNDVESHNCTMRLVQGTSMASPVAAGCAALARQYFLEGWYPTGRKTESDALNPSAALVKAVLLNGAVNMADTPAPPPNRHEGWGRVHLDNSLHFEGDSRRLQVLDFRDAFTTDSLGPHRFAFTAGGNPVAGPLRITLVWTDPPADPAATYALVNDLDLRVTHLATDTEYRGNHFDFSEDGDGFTLPGGEHDRTNNVEKVVLPGDAKGRFEVSVEAARVLVAPQGFALVVGGDILSFRNETGWMLY